MSGRGPVVAIVPAFDEEATVGEVVAALRTALPTLEVVVVDDASGDGTGAVARASGAVVLRPAFNLGIGGAVQLGFRYARRRGAVACVQVDGDGQHPAHEVPRLLEPVLAGRADVVIGSRFLTTGGDRSTSVRRAGMGWLAALVRMRSGRLFSDPTSGFRSFSAAALGWLADHYPEDYPEPQVLAPLLRRGFSVEEIATPMRARSGGRSSIRGLAPVVYMAKVTLAVTLGSMK